MNRTTLLTLTAGILLTAIGCGDGNDGGKALAKIKAEQTGAWNDVADTLTDFKKKINGNTADIQENRQKVARLSLSESNSVETGPSRPFKKFSDKSFSASGPAGTKPPPNEVHHYRHYPAGAVASSPLSLPPPTTDSRFIPLAPEFLRNLQGMPEQVAKLDEKVAGIDARVSILEEGQSNVQKALLNLLPRKPEEPVPETPKPEEALEQGKGK